MGKYSVKYTGFPFHLTRNKKVVAWKSFLPKSLIVGNWVFAEDYYSIYMRERKEWMRYYVPPFDLRRATILDIGAGCGETAKFFLEQLGVERVICIENNPEALVYLEKNAESHSIDVVPESFRNAHLFKYQHDFMKCDIEGYEAIILRDDVLEKYQVPCVLEVHSSYLRDEFRDKGFITDKETLNRLNVYYMHRFPQPYLL